MTITTAEQRFSRETGTKRRGRWLRGIGWSFIWLGGLTLGFVVHQLWITTWVAEQNQAVLAEERVEHFAEVEVTEVYVTSEGDIVDEPSPEPEDAAPASPEESLPVRLIVESAPETGSAFALIRIPSIERLAEGWNIVSGVTIADLKTGAGHMPATPLPGQPGTAVISGHRTTYGAPFHDLGELEAGERIEVDTAIGTHVYEVRSLEVVAPTDIWVTAPRDGAWLTLTTCHPKFSARERLIVFAELVDGPNFEAVESIS